MCCMMMHAMDGDHAGHQQSASNTDESLLDVLKRRYALGEIKREQFEEMKRVLGVMDPSRIESTNLEHSGH